METQVLNDITNENTPYPDIEVLFNFGELTKELDANKDDIEKDIESTYSQNSGEIVKSFDSLLPSKVVVEGEAVEPAEKAADPAAAEASEPDEEAAGEPTSDEEKDRKEAKKDFKKFDKDPKKSFAESLTTAKNLEFNICNKEQYMKYLVYFIDLTENRTEKNYWDRAWLWRDNKELILDMHTEFHNSLVEVQASMSDDENGVTNNYYIFSKEKFEELKGDKNLRTKLLKMMHINKMNTNAYVSNLINLYFVQFAIFLLRRLSYILAWSSTAYDPLSPSTPMLKNLSGYLDYVIMRLLLVYQANAKERCKRITGLLRGHPIGDINTEVKDGLRNSFKLYNDKDERGNKKTEEEETPLDNKKEMMKKCDEIFPRTVLDFGPRLRCRRLVGARINLNQVLDQKCEPKIIRSAYGGKKRSTRRATRAKSSKNNRKTSNVHMSRAKSSKNIKKRRRTKKMYGGGPYLWLSQIMDKIEDPIGVIWWATGMKERAGYKGILLWSMLLMFIGSVLLYVGGDIHVFFMNVTGAIVMMVGGSIFGVGLIMCVSLIREAIWLSRNKDARSRWLAMFDDKGKYRQQIKMKFV